MPGISNQSRQPVGMTLSDWKDAPFPQAQQITSRYCESERINTGRHAKELYETYCEASGRRNWIYLTVGPFEALDAFLVYLKSMEEQTDPMHFAVIDLASMKPIGTLALMHIDPANGVIEVGHVPYSIRVERTQVSTGVISLLLKYVFKNLGYYRFGWKCDAFSASSRRAAECFGFSFKDIFRQAIVIRGRDRDTTWYSVIDGGYPTLRPTYDLWLDEGNSDSQGRQIRRLGEPMERG